jgi:hypothetical protein
MDGDAPELLLLLLALLPPPLLLLLLLLPQPAITTATHPRIDPAIESFFARFSSCTYRSPPTRGVCDTRLVSCTCWASSDLHQALAGAVDARISSVGGDGLYGNDSIPSISPSRAALAAAPNSA